MKDFKLILGKIKRLISEDKFQDALDLYLKNSAHFSDFSFDNQVILIKNNLNRLKEAEIQGTIPRDSLIAERNKLIIRFLENLDPSNKSKENLRVPVLVNSFALFKSENLIGRNDYFKKIEYQLTKNQLIVIQGLAGIGKTSLVSSFIDLISKKKSGVYFDHIVWIRHYVKENFEKNFVEQLNYATPELVANEISNPERVYQKFVNLLNKLKGKNLLIVDNIDDFDLLHSIRFKVGVLRWKIILITRCNIEDQNVVHVTSLSMSDAQNLFYRYYTREKNDEILNKILLEIDCHPLLTELIAKAGMAKIGLDIENLFELIAKESTKAKDLQRNIYVGDYAEAKGFKTQNKLENIVKQIFTTVHLSNHETEILKIIFNFPATYLSDLDLQTLISRAHEELGLEELEVEDIIDKLNLKGWIIKDQEYIKIHLVIQKVLKAQFPIKKERTVQIKMAEAATAAVLSRNISHSLGSHMLSHLKSGVSLINLSNLMDISDFIKERQAYLGAIISGSFSHIGPVNFRESVIDFLMSDFNDVKIDSFQAQNKLHFILKDIALKHSIKEIAIYLNPIVNNQLGEEVSKIENLFVSLPGRNIGRQAIFSIIENYVRASMNYRESRSKNIEKIFLRISVEEYPNNFLLVTLTDERTIVTENEIGQITTSLQQNISTDSLTSLKNSEFQEMLISAGWLRGITAIHKSYPLDRNLFPILNVNQGIHNNLRIQFFLRRRKEILFLIDDSNPAKKYLFEFVQNERLTWSIEQLSCFEVDQHVFFCYDFVLVDQNINDIEKTIHSIKNRISVRWLFVDFKLLNIIGYTKEELETIIYNTWLAGPYWNNQSDKINLTNNINNWPLSMDYIEAPGPIECRLKEYTSTKILIIDERMWEGTAKMNIRNKKHEKYSELHANNEGTKGHEYESLRAKGIEIMTIKEKDDHELAIYNLRSSDEPIGLISKNAEISFVSKVVEPESFHFILIHKGLLDKIFDFVFPELLQGGSAKNTRQYNEGIDYIFKNFQNAFKAKLRYFFHSGRSTKDITLPDEVAILDYTSLEKAFSENKASITELLFNSYA